MTDDLALILVMGVVLAWLSLAVIKLVRGILSSESRELLRQDNRRWRWYYRGLRASVKEVVATWSQSKSRVSDGRVAASAVAHALTDERPSDDEIAARVAEWVLGPNSRHDGAPGEIRWNQRGLPLVAAAEVDEIVEDRARLIKIFEILAEKHGVEVTRGQLDGFFPWSNPRVRS